MAITAEDLKNLPTKYKILIAIGVALLLVYFYYFFFLQAAIQKRAGLEETLETLEVQIAQRQAVVRQIEQHKREIADLNEQLEVLLAKLPERKDIPSLLNGLSDAAHAQGLDIMLFEPLTLLAQEFYYEVPVRMTVRGRYGDIRSFFESVARLPRIVTVADATIRGPGGEYTGGSVILEAECLMKTYMFLDTRDKQDVAPR